MNIFIINIILQAQEQERTILDQIGIVRIVCIDKKRTSV